MPQRFTISVEGGQISGLHWQAIDPLEETVLLLHGANGHAGEWAAFVQSLAWPGTVIAVDLPHHGETVWNAGFDLRECVRVASALLDEFEVERAHLVGSSFGGVVALELAEAWPEVAASVTTLGTGPGGAVELAEALAGAVEANGAKSVYAQVIPAYSYPPDTSEEILREAVERASRPGDEIAAQILRTAFGARVSAGASHPDVPKFVIGGIGDQTSTASSVEALAAQVGTCAWLLPGLGHLPHVESPERLAALLRPVFRIPVQPERVINDLRALDARTRNADGVQRLCWTPLWEETRQWFLGRLAEIPAVGVEVDEAGNCHATLPGESDRVVVVGSHLDSVPNGGNLDGGYGVLAGLEVLRAAAARRRPLPFTLRLTDWADEEGARFGKSLFGSSAVAGTLDVAAFRGLRDVEGRTSEEVLAEHGIDLDGLVSPGARLDDVVTYLELHIEQGPRLEAAETPLAAVTGSLGVKRFSFTLHGTPSHAGGTPMTMRRDPVQAAAACLCEGRSIALDAGALFTCGILSCRPETPTAIAESVTFSLDVRHGDGAVLQQTWDDIVAALARVCEQEGVDLEQQALWEIEPVHFDSSLVESAARVVERMTARDMRLPSGPLHDACEMAGAQIPTVMLFVPSTSGISHAAAEHTPDGALCDGVRGLAALLHDVEWK